MAKRKMNLGGREVEVEDVEFETEREPWSSYVLHDGSSLKVKAVVSEVLRVEGVYAPNGDPVYLVNSSPVVAVSAPENLKRKPPQGQGQQ